jgi:hypothetical protein
MQRWWADPLTVLTLIAVGLFLALVVVIMALRL